MSGDKIWGLGFSEEVDCKVERNSLDGDPGRALTRICATVVRSMTTFFGLCLLIFAAAAQEAKFPFSLEGYEKEIYEWNQKLTVTVGTPDGLVSGSAIVSPWVWFVDPCPYSGMSQLCVGSGKSGEATVVALPSGKHLFALIPENPRALVQDAFKEKILGEADAKIKSAPEYYAAMQQVRGPVEVPAKRYPKLVYFEDIKEPSSVKEINPDDLSTAFGEGYELHSITVEITDEPLAFGKVEAVLPWLQVYAEKQFRLNGFKCVACPVSSENIADMIGSSDFLLEIK